MPTRLCSAPRCPEPAVTRGKCRTHAAAQRQITRSPFDSFYASKPWRIARRAYLFHHPLCEYVMPDGTQCGIVGDSVHHKVELTDGGAPRDPENLMTCCRPHHSAIHAQRRGGVA